MQVGQLVWRINRHFFPSTGKSELTIVPCRIVDIDGLSITCRDGEDGTGRSLTFTQAQLYESESQAQSRLPSMQAVMESEGWLVNC